MPRSSLIQTQGYQPRSGSGSGGQVNRLFDLVYKELRGLAGAIAGPGAARDTIQPTALVHEAWLKLAGNLAGASDRPHFFAIAARAMRQVLADHARAQRRLKRGGGARVLTLADDGTPDRAPRFDLVAFNDSLERLAALSERQARVMEMRLFGALTIEETATLLGVSPGTVKTDWSMARAWMLREMGEG